MALLQHGNSEGEIICCCCPELHLFRILTLLITAGSSAELLSSAVVVWNFVICGRDSVCGYGVINSGWFDCLCRHLRGVFVAFPWSFLVLCYCQRNDGRAVGKGNIINKNEVAEK